MELDPRPCPWFRSTSARTRSNDPRRKQTFTDISLDMGKPGDGGRNPCPYISRLRRATPKTRIVLLGLSPSNNTGTLPRGSHPYLYSKGMPGLVIEFEFPPPPRLALSAYSISRAVIVIRAKSQGLSASGQTRGLV